MNRTGNYLWKRKSIWQSPRVGIDVIPDEFYVSPCRYIGACFGQHGPNASLMISALRLEISLAIYRRNAVDGVYPSWQKGAVVQTCRRTFGGGAGEWTKQMVRVHSRTEYGFVAAGVTCTVGVSKSYNFTIKQNVLARSRWFF